MLHTFIMFYSSVYVELYSSLDVCSLSPAERLLRLDRGERRKEYRRQDFISLDKIPTWREENICKSLLSAAGREPSWLWWNGHFCSASWTVTRLQQFNVSSEMCRQ